MFDIFVTETPHLETLQKCPKMSKNERKFGGILKKSLWSQTDFSNLQL